MQHGVPLCKLPEGLVFPAPLAERVHYDAARHTLAFDGFMTKCRFDELTQLSADPEYRRALEQLFVLSSEEVQPRSSPWPGWIGLAAAAVTALALGTVICAYWLRADSRHGAGARPAVNHSAGR